MVKGVILIILGLASAAVLVFASYHSKSVGVRLLFWTALLATEGTILYSGVQNIRSDRDLRRLKQEAGTIRRFDVAAVVSLTGNWKSTTPPDFSHYLRTGERGVNIRIELKAKDADMRWAEFTDSEPPRIVAGEHNSWVLDYTSHASPGSWVLGVNRDELQTCGTVVMRLYGIDYDATKDGVVTVNSLTLSFFVNGVPAYRCEYYPALRVPLSPELGSPVRVELYGPVAIQPLESPIPVQ
jgi:hypothetical protein